MKDKESGEYQAGSAQTDEAVDNKGLRSIV